MKQTLYEIKKKDGTSEQVKGYVFNKVWGIDKREQGYYVLTYIPLGAFVESSSQLKILKLMVQGPGFFEFDGTKETISALTDEIKKFRNINGWK